MAAEAKPYLTPEEYLAIEREAEYKSEYWNGHMWPLGGAPFAMAGGRPEHNLICLNVGGELRSLLKGRCRVYNSDQRILVSASGLYTYADVSVVCGAPMVKENDTLANPIVIVEVLSKTTELRDRGVKFAQYRALPSLQDYVLVSQMEPRVEVYHRDGEFWILRESVGLDAVANLTSVDCHIALTEIYLGVEFVEDCSSGG